jgi:hypothetical protein
MVKMAMVKSDGMAMHSHNIFNFNVSKMAIEGNSGSTLERLCTATIKDMAVTEVPLTIKLFNKTVNGIWIDPDKVDGHFGMGPVYGTISVAHQVMAGGMDGFMIGQNDTTTTNMINVSAKEAYGVYMWSVDYGINPTLKLTASSNNVIQIQNSTDERHEMVIESEDAELATSGSIGPDSSGQLVFKPIMAGIFEYHCKYHLDTVKGTIEVVPTS